MHVDRRADITNLTGAFRDNANGLTNDGKTIKYSKR